MRWQVKVLLQARLEMSAQRTSDALACSCLRREPIRPSCHVQRQLEMLLNPLDLLGPSFGERAGAEGWDAGVGVHELDQEAYKVAVFRICRLRLLPLPPSIQPDRQRIRQRQRAGSGSGKPVLL